MQIHVRWLDTSQEAQITDLQQGPSNIEWSPDGKWIGYTARVPAKNDFSIHLPEKPAGAKWPDPPIVITKLRWTADGQGILQPGYTHVFAIPSSGGAPKQITSGDYNHGPIRVVGRWQVDLHVHQPHSRRRVQPGRRRHLRLFG